MALTKLCPTCNTQNSPTSPFCVRCGVSLVGIVPRDTEPQGVADPTGTEDELFRVACPECQAKTDGRAERCLYCDATLTLGLPTDSGCVTLKWPWGEQVLEADLRIGREAPAPEELIQQINRLGFLNISRAHADILYNPGTNEVFVLDLNSTNGTFVNDVRIPSHIKTKLTPGATIRFAASLTATVGAGTK
jgi:hypothetical protein